MSLSPNLLGLHHFDTNVIRGSPGTQVLDALLEGHPLPVCPLCTRGLSQLEAAALGIDECRVLCSPHIVA